MDNEGYSLMRKRFTWSNRFNKPKEKVLNREAVAQRCSVKKVLIEIQQNSQENTCARVVFYRAPPVAASVHSKQYQQNMPTVERKLLSFFANLNEKHITDDKNFLATY